MLLKHGVLIMQIINIIIKMEDIRQERSNEDPIVKLNKILKWISLNKKFGTHIKEFMTFQVLKN